MNSIQISYSKSAIKFLEKNSSRLTQDKCDKLLVSAVKQIIGEDTEPVDLKRLQGQLKGYYRIRTGSIRIIFRIKFGIIHIVTVEAIDYRSSIY